ncbi:hypothetical protein [Sphingomonas sp. ACRSK]|uniref:hypothetical protein n=1 Tax=Sphingomonas sp. ACRSK TaxID=2918213 RepID=UPI001EF52724|nr:hypothetical protein [Sphingomonas sp. ACRSK]MCG7347308.1 hypothetical protein [Sphingomonas sp. ACRSK]
MKRVLAATLGFAAAAMISGTPAAAQQATDLKVSAGKPYKHKLSGLRLPATLAGAPRIKAIAIGEDLLDVSASYESSDGAELLSLYVYRQASGALPVWFDRARWAIENRPDVYGKPVAAVGSPSFVPPGQQTESGLIAAYTLNKGPYRSTGVAILPFGEWLVKLRYSSKTLESASLATAMREALAALEWPREVAPAPATSPVAECPTPLALSGEAKPASTNGAAALMAAFMGLAVHADTKKQDAPTPQPAVSWCRDATILKAGGVYRPNAATDRYLIALSDAGRGIFVQPDAASALLAESKPAEPRWSVALIDLGTITNFQAQDRLPPPEQVVEHIIRGPINSRVNTWGKDRSINISSGAFSEAK